MLDESIFGDIEPNRVRFAKPKTAKMPKKNTKAKAENFKISTPKKMTPVTQPDSDSDSFETTLEVGNKVNHQRFGRGEVIKIEGVGADAKAEIKFQKGDTKKLLLRFAKLQIMRS
jgi:DNA helicase-2/ATP-dependent DNA helicase PcrA